MKRLHVHVAVDNLGDAIGFYAALFAAQPPVVKPDDAKWMLDDACCGPQAEPKLQAASARCTS